MEYIDYTYIASYNVVLHVSRNAHVINEMDDAPDHQDHNCFQESLLNVV